MVGRGIRVVAIGDVCVDNGAGRWGRGGRSTPPVAGAHARTTAHAELERVRCDGGTPRLTRGRRSRRDGSCRRRVGARTAPTPPVEHGTHPLLDGLLNG